MIDIKFNFFNKFNILHPYNIYKNTLKYIWVKKKKKKKKEGSNPL